MPPQKVKKKGHQRSRRTKGATGTTPARPRRQPPGAFRWKRLLALCLLGVLVAGIGAWRVIDKRVAARITSFEAPSVPVIYSSPLDLRSVIARAQEDPVEFQRLLREVLADRRYTETKGAPTRPGEFSISEHTLSVYTRDFNTASGTPYRGIKASLALNASGTASAATQRVLVEPQILSYLGDQDVRASRFVPLDQIPEVVQDAVLSIEDERFFSHFGIDILGIFRAIAKNIIAGRLVQGGSTLTQQLAKNLFLSPKKTFTRKLMEVPTALSLERHLSKREILELYLNEVYLGQEASVSIHGMPQASIALFGKDITDVTLDEAATLAGIIKAPSHYNPRRHPERARERRDVVLAKMRALGQISESQYASAIKRPTKIAQQQEHRRIAPYFTATLENELSESIDLENAKANGLAVYTGLDLGIQRCAEATLQNGLQALETSHPNLKKGGRTLQGALVAIEPYSGLVRAWVGGRDFSESQFNRVNLAQRQIGSTIKPFLYLTALDGSLNSYKTATAVSILEDRPVEVQLKNQGTWVPENFDHEFRGDVTLRYALENSLNMPALYIAERIGLNSLKRTLSAFKIGTNAQEVPSLALGALDTNLLRLTAAYGALANGGVYIKPRLYVSALDTSQERLATSDVVEERVADETASFVLTHILRGVLDRGTGRSIRAKGFLRDAAGKTGTSDSGRDAWFVGYTPSLVVGTWIGFDDNSPLGLTGGGAAAPIWGEFMRCASPFIPSGEFSIPPGVTFSEVDIKTGQLATPECPRELVFSEAFVKGTEPVASCTLHSSGGETAPDEDSEQTDPPGQGTTPSKRPSGFWSSVFGR